MSVGNRLKFSASSLAARILRGVCTFATILGVVTFRIDCDRYNGRLVAVKKRYCFKWISMVMRILIFYLYYITNKNFIEVLQLSHLKILIWVRISCIFICVIGIVIMQYCYEDQVIRLVNGFLRLFRRINSLPGREQVHFGGLHELVLLILAVLCQVYQCVYVLPVAFDDISIPLLTILFFETYCSVCAALIGHICFVGYLSVGVLYDQVNQYVRQELREQFTDLRAATVSRRKLKAAEYRLDECLAIYNEIQRISQEFQRLFDVPLCFVLLFGFLTMAVGAFFIMLNQFLGSGLWFYELKMLTDLMLLTLAIQAASNNSRVIRRLSLENYYVTERKDWHTKLELFFSRLNYQEFHVCPLGLFEVSNQLILVFLSALVTYLTYIMQYGMQSL